VNPAKRLGYGDAGWAALVRHPFFRPINWNKLESKSIAPPFQPATENNFDLTYDLEELLLEESPLTAHTVKRAKSNKKNSNDPILSKHDRDLIMIEERFKYFDFTIFEKYEGFKDPVTMTVGDPPDWVKPAFEGAEQGDILPIKRITTGSTQHEDYNNDMGGQTSQWRGPNRSASTSNLATATASVSNMGKYDQDPSWKRSSMGAIRKLNGSSSNLANTTSINNESSTSLSEEYALSLQGIRKKQSTRSFRERRERDRKSIQVAQHP
jgi:serine/threonine kinase 32